MKHLIGAGLVAILAFVVRFVVPLPFALDLYVHDTYGALPIGIIGFWVLLLTATVWLAIAGLKLIRRT